MSIRIIGAAIGHGAQDPESQNAPDFVRSGGFAKRLEALLDEQGPERFWEASWDTTIYPHFTHRRSKDLPVVSEFCERLQKVVGRVLAENDFPFVIGGDHSCAVGTWSGAARIAKERGQESFGLLWVDAHLDAHTFETSPSAALHGMPLACLLGHGQRNLVHCAGFTPKIDPQRCVVFGARSWEDGEPELLSHLGVRVFEAEEILSRGMGVCAEEAINRVHGEGGPYGVSVDLDAFDPQYVPGVGSREPLGMDPEEFCRVCSSLKLGADPWFSALEIVEFAPAKDLNGLSLSVIDALAAALLAEKMAVSSSL